MSSIFDSKVDKENIILIRNNVKNTIMAASEAHDIVENCILDIGPQKDGNAKEFFKKAKITTLDIDKNSGADIICDICFANEIICSETFDVVICTEVLEHTLNPFNAVNEIYRILKIGGIVYASIPFNFKIHSPTPDCWRFTETGLKQLFKNFSKVSISSNPSADQRHNMPAQYIIVAIK